MFSEAIDWLCTVFLAGCVFNLCVGCSVDRAPIMQLKSSVPRGEVIVLNDALAVFAGRCRLDGWVTILVYGEKVEGENWTYPQDAPKPVREERLEALAKWARPGRDVRVMWVEPPVKCGLTRGATGNES